jgi:hypothetical protein
MAAEPFWRKYIEAADRIDRRDEEQFHLSELTFATEAASWMNGEAVDGCL